MPRIRLLLKGWGGTYAERVTEESTLLFVPERNCLRIGFHVREWSNDGWCGAGCTLREMGVVVAKFVLEVTGKVMVFGRGKW